MGVLKNKLEPTDFAESKVMVSDWHHGDFYSANAYRIWLCNSNNHWFQRHEWGFPHRNSTELEDWRYLGMDHKRTFPAHFRDYEA